MGWVIFLIWLALWFEIARRIKKVNRSWIVIIGGSLLGSLLAFIVLAGVIRVVQVGFNVNPNPKTKNWDISEQPKQDDFWARGQPDRQTTFDPYIDQPTSPASPRTIKVTSSEYGKRWSFTVPSGQLECISNAVIMHTAYGTYSINGKAMGRYAGKYPEWRKIAKPVPGLESDPNAKMPPPHDLIKRGLALCK